MVNLTFFEIHLHDASFEANAPFSGSSDEESTDVEDEETDLDIDVDTDERNGGPPKVVSLVLGLLFLVGVAAVVRKLRGGDDEPVIEDVGEDVGEPVEA